MTREGGREGGGGRLQGYKNISCQDSGAAGAVSIDDDTRHQGGDLSGGSQTVAM